MVVNKMIWTNLSRYFKTGWFASSTYFGSIILVFYWNYVNWNTVTALIGSLCIVTGLCIIKCFRQTYFSKCINYTWSLYFVTGFHIIMIKSLSWIPKRSWFLNYMQKWPILCLTWFSFKNISIRHTETFNTWNKDRFV